MADTDDVQASASKFDNQLAKVRESDIDDRDREAILGLIRQWDSESSINQGTISSYMNRLRLSAERADTPLVEMHKEDVDSFVFNPKHEYELGDGTLRNYRKSLRKFFSERGADWATDITVVPLPTGLSTRTNCSPTKRFESCSMRRPTRAIRRCSHRLPTPDFESARSVVFESVTSIFRVTSRLSRSTRMAT